ncbi:MAG: hypothetical protein ACSW8G_06100, partial [Bacillota bacterium]
LDAMDKHSQALRKESDARFAEMMDQSEKRFDVMMNEMNMRFDEQQRHFDFVIENKIMPKIDVFSEYLPGAFKSYEKLEEKVDKIAMRQDVLERTLMEHLQRA